MAESSCRFCYLFKSNFWVKVINMYGQNNGQIQFHYEVMKICMIFQQYFQKADRLEPLVETK